MLLKYSFMVAMMFCCCAYTNSNASAQSSLSKLLHCCSPQNNSVQKYKSDKDIKVEKETADQELLNAACKFDEEGLETAFQKGASSNITIYGKSMVTYFLENKPQNYLDLTYLAAKNGAPVEGDQAHSLSGDAVRAERPCQTLFWLKAGEIESKSIFRQISLKTAVQKAAQNGYKAVVEYALKNGAIWTSKDANGNQLIDNAIKGNHRSTVELLELHTPAGFLPPIEVCKIYGKILLYACQNGYENLAERSLTKIDPNFYDEKGMTPLMWVAREGFYTIAELLLKNGADPNIVSGNKRKTTAALIAGQEGEIDIVELLEKYHADTTQCKYKNLSARDWLQNVQKSTTVISFR